MFVSKWITFISCNLFLRGLQKSYLQCPSEYPVEPLTRKQEPELSTKILWDSFLYQLPGLGCAIHTHSSPIFKEMNIPRLFLHLFFCLQRNQENHFARLKHLHPFCIGEPKYSDLNWTAKFQCHFQTVPSFRPWDVLHNLWTIPRYEVSVYSHLKREST